MKKLILLFVLIQLGFNIYSQSENKFNIDLKTQNCLEDFESFKSSMVEILELIPNYYKIQNPDSAEYVKDFNFKIKSATEELDKLQEIHDNCLSLYNGQIKKQLDEIQKMYDELLENKNYFEKTLQDYNKQQSDIVAGVLLDKLSELFSRLEKKQTEIEGLKNNIDSLKNVVLKEKRDSIKFLKSNNLSLDKKIKDFDIKLQLANAELKGYKEKQSFFNVGLAFGVNFDNKGEYNYYVKPDSTLYEKNVGKGGNGMVSAIASFEFDINQVLDSLFNRKKSDAEKLAELEKNKFLPGTFKLLLNIPLTETLLQDKENAIGLFNKKMALGFGLGIDLLKSKNRKQSLTLFYIVNVSSVKKVDINYYTDFDYKFTEGYPNKIDVSNYETFNEPNITHFIGLYLSMF